MVKHVLQIRWFVLVIGMGMGALIMYCVSHIPWNIGPKSASIKEYSLLAKRISVEDPNDVLVAFNPLRKQMRELVGKWGSSIAVYFEYLPTGVSIGINEKDEYSLRSLIKLPIVMAFYHNADQQGIVVDPLVTIEKRHLDKRFGSLWQRGEGATIQLSEAVKLALVDSDNTAIGVLSDHVPLTSYQEVYEGLDIDFPEDPGNIKLSAKQYASILKALYFSSILTKESSQRILDELTQTPFDDKLVAPIPKDVKVAHKIGVYENEQFQDCGIVYYPRRQYLLCMISVSSDAEAQKRMSLISKTVYDFIDSANAEK